MKHLGHHERIVNMLCCVTSSEPMCLAVEYCSDGNLLQFLRRRRKYMLDMEGRGIDWLHLDDSDQVDGTMALSLKDLLSFSWQVCVGLQFLGQKGFVHRDIAARNALVHEGKKVKIGDFGLCRFVDKDNSYWGRGGRLPIKWMAPEAIKSFEFSAKSDAWSFGVLLFEVVTLGGSPYPGIQPVDLGAYLETGKRMDRPENCPEAL
jgi:serine/threonine protein kinase